MNCSPVLTPTRWWTLALGLVVAFALVACGSSSTSATQVPSAPASPVPSAPTSPAVQTPAVDGAQLLASRCGSCHPVSKATSTARTQAEWDQVVTRMISNGAQLSEAEQATLIGYLSQAFGK